MKSTTTDEFIKKSKEINYSLSGKEAFAKNQRLYDAIQSINFTEDTELKQKELIKKAFFENVADNNRLLNILDLMKETECKLRIVDAEADPKSPKRGGAFLDPLSSKHGKEPVITLYYDTNNVLSLETTLIHEALGHLKSYKNKIPLENGHIKTSNFYDFVMENALEEANAVMVEAKEAFKSENVWGEFKKIHPNMAKRYENLHSSGKSQQEIDKEIFKSWFDEPEYQNSMDIEGGKGYSDRYVSEYIYYRQKEHNKIIKDRYKNTKREYPFLAPKDLGGILEKITERQITDKDINIADLSKKFKVSQKNWLLLNDVASKNLNEERADHTYTEFSSYNYTPSEDFKYIKDNFKFIVSENTDYKDNDIIKDREQVSFLLNSYIKSETVATKNGELVKVINEWLKKEKLNPDNSKYTQSSIKAIESLIKAIPEKYPNYIKNDMENLEKAEKFYAGKAKSKTGIFVRNPFNKDAIRQNLKNHSRS